jgi:MFS family permease
MTAAATGARHLVVLWMLVAAAICYLDRVAISTAAPTIKHDLGLSDSQMGLVFSAFTLAYALFEIPGGWLADRFGARLTLTRVVVWWSAFTAATGAATGLGSLLALRFLFGAGEAGMFPGAAQAFSRWLPATERGRAFGFTVMMAALGSAMSQPLVVFLLTHASWRAAFVLFGAVGFVWAAGFWRWFRDDPAEHPAVNAEELRTIVATRGIERHGASVPWRRIFSNRSVLALCFTHLAAIYAWYFPLTWLPTYLLRARGFDLTEVGWLAALPLLAIGAFTFFGGWLSDLATKRMGARRGRRAAGLVGHPLAAVAIVAAVLTPNPFASALFFSCAAGLGALGVACAWAAATDVGGEHAGVVSGAMNMFGNLGGTASPLVIGFTLDRLGLWEPSLLSVAVAYLLAAAGWLFVDAEERIGKA